MSAGAKQRRGIFRPVTVTLVAWSFIVFTFWGLSLIFEISHESSTSCISLRNGILSFQYYPNGNLFPRGDGFYLVTLGPTPESYGRWLGLSKLKYADLRSAAGVQPWGPMMYAIIPMWLVLLVSTIVLLLVFLTWRWRTRSLPGHCLVCNYDLTGNLSGKCPECGTPIPQETKKQLKAQEGVSVLAN